MPLVIYNLQCMINYKISQKTNDASDIAINFSINHNGFEYQISALPIVHFHNNSKIHFAEFNLEILTPKGFIIADFYPESQDLFSTELPSELSNELLQTLIDISYSKDLNRMINESIYN